MKASINEERIRLKAFELWHARGCPVGSPQDDWFMAKLSLETATQSPRPVTVVSPGDLPLGLRIVTEQDLASSSVPPAPARSARRRARRVVEASSPPASSLVPAKTSSKRKQR